MTGEKPGSFRWFLVFWLFILSAVAFLDRVNISVAGASIASAYHLTNVQLGTVFSALLWGYALFQTLGGRLADQPPSSAPDSAPSSAPSTAPGPDTAATAAREGARP